MKTLTHSVLKELLDYNAETGVFTWKHRDQSWFVSYRSYTSFCGKYANKVAGNNKICTISGKTYRAIMVLGVSYAAHRVAWFYVNGEWPTNDIDHIDGIGVNNKTLNLRDVTVAENGRNKRLPSTNKSGVIGVCWHKRDQHWRATIKVNQKTISLGGFSSIDDAMSARQKASVKYGFHKNHGTNRPL